MKRLMVAVALLSLSSCTTTPDVSTQYEKSFDFAKTRTFNASIANSWGNAITESMVLNAIEAGLVARGLQKAAVGTADVDVLIHGTTQRKHTLETLYSGIGGRDRRGTGSFGMATTTGYEYTEGTLIVDMFDRTTQRLIWRGVAVDELKRKQDDQEQQMNKAAQKLFANFPPGRSK